MSELMWRLYYLEEGYSDIETTNLTIHLKVNTGTYADVESIIEEIAESLDWMTPYGGHNAILAGEWEISPIGY